MYRISKGGGRIEIDIEEVALERVFTESLVAISDAFSEAAAARGAPTTHEIAVAAADLPGLLDAWVRELVRLAEVEDFLPERVEKLRLAGDGLRCTVAGERSLPRELVPSVVGERSGMRRTEEGAWEAAIVLEAGH